MAANKDIGSRRAEKNCACIKLLNIVTKIDLQGLKLILRLSLDL